MFAPNAVALALGAGLVAVVDVQVLLPLVGTVALAAAVVLVTGRRGRPARAPAGPLPSSAEA